MASHRDMKALAENADRVRSLARALLAQEDHVWTDWEIDFLESMAAHQGPEPLTQRQREVLSELEAVSTYVSSVEGMSVGTLIRECFEARLDLDEEDEAFVESLAQSGKTSLRRRPLTRLLACSRRLGLIEHYVRV